MATFEFLPKLSMRKDLYTFYADWRGGIYRKKPVYDYALVNFNDHFIDKDLRFHPEEISGNFFALLSGKYGKTLFSEDDIVLFKKGAPDTSDCLLAVSENPAGALKQIEMLIDGSLKLAKYTMKSANKNGLLPISFTWEKTSDNASLYDIYFFIYGEKIYECVKVHPLAYRYYIPRLPVG
ncbi:MAG: hypothetical protein HQL28_06465, partial [Candidatus Omnitrophica bacterium]|nr:hypothetical protein [Candidatus Omnitrophota bacterium]